MPVTLVLILSCSSGQPQVPDLLSWLPECWDKPVMAGWEGNFWERLFTKSLWVGMSCWPWRATPVMAALGRLRPLPERVHVEERGLELSQLDGRDAKRPDVTQLIVSTLEGHSCHLWSHPVGRDPQRVRSGPGAGERGDEAEWGHRQSRGEGYQDEVAEGVREGECGALGIRALWRLKQEFEASLGYGVRPAWAME